jgi:hypothetical protein
MTGSLSDSLEILLVYCRVVTWATFFFFVLSTIFLQILILQHFYLQKTPHILPNIKTNVNVLLTITFNFANFHTKGKKIDMNGLFRIVGTE